MNRNITRSMQNITKNILLSGSLFLSLGLSAQQREIEMALNLDSPADGAVFQSGETVPLSVSVTNNGPDEIIVGDTLFVILPTGEPTWGTMTEDVPDGATAELFTQDITLPTVNNTTTVDVCVQLIDDPSSQITLGGNPVSISYIDPDSTNNIVCHTVTVQAPTAINYIRKSDATLKLYPNPAGSTVRIPVNQTSDNEVSVSVKDLLGRTVLTKTFKKHLVHNYLEVNVSDLNEGLYIVEQYDGSLRSTGKLSIRR